MPARGVSGEAKEDAGKSAGRELPHGGVANKRKGTPDPKRRRITNLARPLQSGRGLRVGDTGPGVELPSSVSDRKRPQKMGSSRMDDGGVSNLQHQANVALYNPILVWRGRKCERLADALSATEFLEEAGGKIYHLGQSAVTGPG
ncbi:unnamed protein product, partial [Closterium sp. NIES-54]